MKICYRRSDKVYSYNSTLFEQGRTKGRGEMWDENWTIYARNTGGYDAAVPDGREGPEAHSVTWERVQIPFISRPYDVRSGINARMWTRKCAHGRILHGASATFFILYIVIEAARDSYREVLIIYSCFVWYTLCRKYISYSRQKKRGRKKIYISSSRIGF